MGNRSAMALLYVILKMTHPWHRFRSNQNVVEQKCRFQTSIVRVESQRASKLTNGPICISLSDLNNCPTHVHRSKGIGELDEKSEFAKPNRRVNDLNLYRLRCLVHTDLKF